MTTAATPDPSPAPRPERPHPAAELPAAPPVAYLLADHLDAVLAHGEDLLATGWRPEKLARCPATIAAQQDGQRRTIDAVRVLELALLSRALKACERSAELAHRDGRFAPVARLFAAYAGQLEDAAREAGDATDDDFETGDASLAYLRSRGLIAADWATYDDCGAIVVTPSFRVAKRIELGPLLDLVATYLDTLDLHFDLYPEAPEARAPAGATAGRAEGGADDGGSRAPGASGSSLAERLEATRQDDAPPREA